MKIGKLKKVGISLLTVFMLGTLLTANMTTTEAADETVEQANNIKINLFDYSVGNEEYFNSNDENYMSKREYAEWFYPNADQNAYNNGINKNHSLKFLSNASSSINNGNYPNKDLAMNIWTGPGGVVRENIVRSKLEDGFPVLNLSNSESLSYLFDTNSNSSNCKEVYETEGNLLTKDDNGYYSFDSAKQYAYYNKETNKFEKDVAIGTGYAGGSSGNVEVFYPFNTRTEVWNKTRYGQNNAATLYSSGIALGNGQANHYFGMTMETEFYQPVQGRINNQDMIFEFSGDDDVWVFIDDQLVLDLGGIKDAVSGTINFSSGEVKIVENGTEKIQTTMWGNNNSVFAKKFDDYSTHTIKFFYLERGNGASNCKMKFNLPTIPDQTVMVTKQVTDKEGNIVGYSEDVDFMFEISKGNETLNGQEYEVRDRNNNFLRKGFTTSEGRFSLKHGETAYFIGLFPANSTYEVKEIGAYLQGYEIQINDTQCVINDDGPLPSATTGSVKVSERNSVVFKNVISKTSSLSIKKEVSSDSTELIGNDSFVINVKINDKTFVGDYSINSVTYSTNNGQIQIKNGQTININGLPYGSSFEIKENNNVSYNATYNITGDTYENVTDGKAYAKVKGASANVTVSNTINKDRKTSVDVTKGWIDGTDTSLRPEYIKVELYKNGSSINEQIKLNSSNDWKGKFNGLDYYYYDTTTNQYKICEYSVKEVDTPENYISEVKKDQNNNYSFIITNTLKTSLTITKTIDEINTEDGDAIFTFKVINKNNQNDYFYKTLRLTEAGSSGTQSITISDLKYGDEYIIEELDTMRYTPSNENFNDIGNTDYAKKEIKLESSTNTVDFYNKLTYENNFSHTDVVINEFTVNEDGTIDIIPNKLQGGE